MDLLVIGDKNRNTSFTKMNAHSSRSHAVYMVKVERRMRYTPEQLEAMEASGDIPD
jgi:kinesin family protein 5